MKYQDIDEAFTRTRPSLHTLKRILHFIKPYRREIIAPFVIEAFWAASVAITPFLLMMAIDEFIVPATRGIEGALGVVEMLPREHARNGLLVLSALMALNVALNVVLQMVQRLYIRRAGEKAINDLRRHMFGHIQRLSMDFFDREKQGRIIARLDRDIENLEPLITFVPLFFVHCFFSFIIVVGILASNDWRLCGLIVAFSPLVLVAGFVSEKWGLPVYRRIRKTVSTMTSQVAEEVTGVQVVQAFGREEHNLDQYQNLLDQYRSHQVAAAHVRGITFPSMIMVFGVARAGVLLYGAHALTAGHISLGLIPAAMIYIGMIYGPIMMIAHLYDHLLSSSASSERVVQLMDYSPTIVDKPDATPIPAIEGHVSFDHVYFKYDDEPDNPWILEDIDFEAPVGSIVALVGSTGAGKTSITNLIPRFYEPQQGRILIDGIDICDVTQQSLHEQMGIVLQENFLFTGTVMDNLLYGRPDATEEEAVEAAKELASYDTICNLADGFQTDVRERGGAISHGERQLICFTRAMIANPRILILDEATSAVDTDTEIIIQNALWKLMEGRTTFVVAHRLSTIRHADTILVIEGGRIIEMGDHDTLIANRGEYADMFEEFIRGPDAL